MSLGAKYFKKTNKQKVSGADMLPGVLLSLSYGMCPINPSGYLVEDNPTYLTIGWGNLGLLIDALAESMSKEFKPLTFGSAKQYLSALRKGYRANRNGMLPPLNVSMSEESMTLTIPKRDFEVDRQLFAQQFADGALNWIFSYAS
jgi:hypothetical protein